MNNQHNIFYYFADNTKIYSKILALEEEKQKKQQCCLYYHDNFYDLVNWKNEPPHTLDWYYTEQAKKIRDEYDYVVLCYSGGIDSTNILETFYFNNIKLDKIITVGAFSQDKYIGDDSNHNGECYFNVFPYIKELGLEDIFQVLDYTTHYDNISTFTLLDKKSWINEIGSWFSPNIWFWYDLDKFVVPHEIRNQKTAIIFGRDKPALYQEKDNFYFKFNDSVINAYGFYKGNNNVDVINFYWDPSFPEILLKQLHILKQIKKLNNGRELVAHPTYKTNNSIDIGKLIYNIKKPLQFISPKSPSTIISLRDSYLKNKKNSDIYDFFKKGVLEIKGRLNNTTIPHIYSKKYYIS